MGEEVNVKISIKPTWNIVQEIRDKAVKFMEDKGKGRDVIEATMMCVTELIENAVKYGSAKTDTGNIEFDMVSDGKTVKIKVANGVLADADAKSVIGQIDKIKGSNDPAKLYTERLMELLENPRPGESKLGLYRIAYEGEFKLDYSFKNSILTIFAERTI